jgi:hypothetical protein
MIPIFLEGYDPFGPLHNWKVTESGYATNRSWELRSFSMGTVLCRLNWSTRGQLASLEKAAMSAQEAVWLALGEFYRLECMYVRQSDK